MPSILNWLQIHDSHHMNVTNFRLIFFTLHFKVTPDRCLQDNPTRHLAGQKWMKHCAPSPRPAPPALGKVVLIYPISFRKCDIWYPENFTIISYFLSDIKSYNERKKMENCQEDLSKYVQLHRPSLMRIEIKLDVIWNFGKVVEE